MTSEEAIARQRAIINRLMELDEILREAANEYNKVAGPAASEKVVLVLEEMEVRKFI